MGLGRARTTHTWLKPLYDLLEGKTSASLSIGSSTGIVGLYGSSGLAVQLATGTNGLFNNATSFGASGFGATGIGGSGLYVHLGRASYNGGTGNFYTSNDIVTALKNVGILKP